MKHTIGLAVLILTAGFFFSCTDGEYKGSKGEGNFNLIDRTGTLNGKYISVVGEKTGGGVKVGFNPAFPRQKVTKGKVSAPLYDLALTGDQYIGNDSFSKDEFTVYIYASETAPSSTDKGVAVTFYVGSGLIEWEN
jgi:hypothetical protein